jgi:uncharacterized protein (DUF1778 family)
MVNPRGRPELPEGEQREKPLRIRLTPEERHILDAAAALSGESRTSTWARGILMRAAERANKGIDVMRNGR